MTSTPDLELVSTKLDLLNERVASLKGHKESTPWYAVVTGVLGIPGIVILMVLNFSQYRTDTQTRAKTIDERTKTQLEVEQLRAKSTELQSAVGSADVSELRTALSEAIPLLQRSAQQLERTSAATAAAGTSLVPRFIVVWAFLNFVGVVFSAVFTAWDLVSGAPYTIRTWLERRARDQERDRMEALRTEQNARPNATRDYEEERREQEALFAHHERRRQSRDLITQWSATTLRLLPRLLDISLHIAILIVVVGPLFDLAADGVGSTVRFQQIVEAARHFEFRRCLSYVAEVVTPRGGGF